MTVFVWFYWIFNDNVNYQFKVLEHHHNFLLFLFLLFSCYAWLINRKVNSNFKDRQISFFFFSLNDHNNPGDYFLSLMVYAGYVCVAIIHQTLTWTTRALSCAQMLMHVNCNCMRGVYRHWLRVCSESWLPKENPLPHLGIKPASVAWWSNAPVPRCWTRLMFSWRHDSVVYPD